MRERIIVWAVAAATLAPFYALALPGGKVLPYFEWSDYTALQLPVHEFIRDELLAGRVPLWIPWLGCGTPLHAGQQAGVFYPGLTLPLVVFPANYALKLSLLLHLALAYAGQYRLCRYFGGSPLAASFGALVVVQSGFLVNHVMAGHVTIAIGAALVPWFLLALVRLLDSPGPLRAAVAAVIGGAFALGSQPQISYYALLYGTVWTIGWLVFARGWRVRLHGAAWLGLAAIAAGLIGAVQILPSLELLFDGRSASPRGGETYAAGYALDALDLARLVAPNLAGNPFLDLPQLSESDFYHEHVAYLGLGAWVLAAYGLTRASVARWQWGAAALVLVGLAAALGESTPWFSLLGRVVPGLFWFRCPGRAFALLTPWMALLAARGFDAVLSGERRAPVRRLGPAVLLLLAGACVLVPALTGGGGAFTWQAVLGHAWSTCRAELFAPAVFAANTALAMLLASRQARRVADLVRVRGRPEHELSSPPPLPSGEGRGARGRQAPPPARRPTHPLPSGEGRGEGGLRQHPACTSATRYEAGYQSTSHEAAYTALMLLAVALSDLGYNNAANFWLEAAGPREIPREVLAIDPPIRFVDAPRYPDVDAVYLTYSRMVETAVHNKRSLIGVNDGGIMPGALARYHRAVERAPFNALAVGGCDYATRREGPWIHLRGSLPRIRLVREADRELVFTPVDELTSTQLDVLRGALVGSVEIAAEDPQHLALHVSAPERGVLVVADLFYRGWQCEIDGRPVTIEAAHGLFRAVTLDKGQHRVELHYRSAAFRWGVWCSLAGLVIAAGVAAVRPK